MKVSESLAKMSKLKNILRNFLEHYEELNKSHRDKLEYIEQSKENGRTSPPPLSLYDQEYLKLRDLTEMLKTDPNYPMAEGVSDVNRKKNRYKDILPCKFHVNFQFLNILQ